MHRPRVDHRAAASPLLIPAPSSLLLAVSGGADSMALLHGAADVAPRLGWTLSVGHVHHGWRGREADRDLHFVAEHARRLGLPFLSRRCDARAASRQLGLSPEAGARHVRYEALRAMAAEAGAERTATAHQQDDVLESHLLAKERGGGLALLAGPRASRADGVVRPLLSVPRAEILRYLGRHGVAFRRDASNGDLRLARNRIRRAIAGLDAAQRATLLAEIARLRAERDRMERELEDEVLPRLRFSSGAAFAEAAFLASLGDDLLRAALERIAFPLARRGRPPMTGREREQILRLLRSGRDFRFEAGRRIRFERRADRFRVRLSPGAAGPGGRSGVYDSRIDTLDGKAGGPA